MGPDVGSISLGLSPDSLHLLQPLTGISCPAQCGVSNRYLSRGISCPAQHRVLHLHISSLLQFQALQPWWYSHLAGLGACFEGRTPHLHSHLLRPASASLSSRSNLSWPMMRQWVPHTTYHKSQTRQPGKLQQKRPESNGALNQQKQLDHFIGQASQPVHSSHHNGLLFTLVGSHILYKLWQGGQASVSTAGG